MPVSEHSKKFSRRWPRKKGTDDRSPQLAASMGKESQSLDPATKSDLAVLAKPNDVEDVFVDADRGTGGVVVSMGCFSGCCGGVFADDPRGGSSRSVPLADR
jgi:hypothetical protein